MSWQDHVPSTDASDDVIGGSVSGGRDGRAESPVLFRSVRGSRGFPGDPFAGIVEAIFAMGPTRGFSPRTSCSAPASRRALGTPKMSKPDQADRRLREELPSIDSVCERIATSVEAAESDLAVDFCRLFLGKAPAEVFQARTTDGILAMVLGAFRFLRDARPGRVDVSVINAEFGDEGASTTVVRTNLSERPFIVDTIREYLHAQDLSIERIVYPLLDVERDAEGEVLAIHPVGKGASRESLVHCEIARISDPARLAEVEAEISRRLTDVVQATDDFSAMMDAVDVVIGDVDRFSEEQPGSRSELAEVRHFLEWLKDRSFVFLGYRSYDLVDDAESGERCVVVEAGSGLGLLRDEEGSKFSSPVPVSSLGAGMRQLAELGPPLIISKTNAESTVHRRARMDYVGVKKLGPDGHAVGEHRFVGLFTSRAYSEDAAAIPILRHKLAQILEGEAAIEGSHDYKEIITIFNSLPKEELFVTSAEEIGSDIRAVLASLHTEHVRVTLKEDPLGRGASVMVILPRDRFSVDVRKRIESALISSVDGEVLNYHLAMGEGDQARLHFYIAAPDGRASTLDTGEIEVLVGQLIRTWGDLVYEGLEADGAFQPDEARALVDLYDSALSPEYKAAIAPVTAVRDIKMLEAMGREGRSVSLSFTNRPNGVAVAGVTDATELKVYLRNDRLILSDFIPILEDAGLRVIAGKRFEVSLPSSDDATVYVFGVQDRDGQRIDVEGRGELVSEMVLAGRSGQAENDQLNSLVLTAGLHWREVDVLRGYVGYAFQIGAVPSRLTLRGALVQHPAIARTLFEEFQVKFDPDSGISLEERASALEDIGSAFHAELRGVSALADDRALRRLGELIQATVRTNYYRHGGANPTFLSGGVPYISYKFSCREMDVLRGSRLLFEVWVHSARMEGVHLRGASVARGGIRWSDRPDDFRTEVLGLVKTQMVKNAVIIPAGSKGGFITRLSPADPEERFEEAKAQYMTLQRGLLDITDNLVDGRPVSPEGVVAFDNSDPYLVVAADKGTATFSDIANGIAAEYGFWLDDAYASGGSNGYDHKAVGITARGAWECVKRHFREKGKDIQAEPFTVAGIGDMSGDVFGNGMLLSEQIKLIAAFDHRHVFIDPDPDPAVSFAERSRVFELGRSSWEDYDQTTLSEGGMIVPRGAKEVELTPQARKALGLPMDETEPMDGETLIRAVLKAPVELLWNGGIGTYVKATGETHVDAGDPANDAVRIDVTDLRCEVLGEGGNLGFTQRSRIEYASRGGRVNTDAMDNSAGVDMSDHEVNLKILLAPAVAAGKMTADARNQLLEDLTDPVADLVLNNNRTQSLAVSLDERRAHEGLDDFRDLMFSLEKTGELDRLGEGLPTLDLLVERRERGQSLYRPELCVLLAYSKLSLMSRLLRSALPDDPVTQSYLLGYFPPAAVMAAGHENLESHRLHREIIASQLTNDLVDLMGATFITRLVRDTGRSEAEIARAWLVASRLADHRAVLTEMAAQANPLNSRVTYRWLLGLARVLERTTRWVLQSVDPETAPARIVEENLEGLAVLRDAFADIVGGEDRALFEARVREIREVGADMVFSERLMTLRFLDQLLAILEISRETSADPSATGRAYYAISEAFEVPWLRRSIFAAAGDDQWEQRAAQVLSEDLSRAHRQMVVAVMTSEASADDPDQAVADLMHKRRRGVERFAAITEELRAEDAPSFAAMTVAARELTAFALRLG